MVPWRNAGTSKQLPHRRFQVAPPAPRDPLGTLISALQDYDSKKVISDAISSDSFHWKVTHFIKTKKDYETVIKLYQRYFVIIKDIFLFEASQQA